VIVCKMMGIGRPLPNPAAHADAREASHLLSPSQSRAGGRERQTAA
jgi:hypothetical protein